MTQERSATVIRTTRLNGGGWSAVIQQGREKQFVTVSENHPEGTRLVLRDGQWVKP